MHLFSLVLFFRKANEEAYYLTTLNEIAQNVTFQHTYQVYKLGASPIEVAQLIVKIPLTFKDLHLIYMYKSQVRIYIFTFINTKYI